MLIKVNHNYLTALFLGGLEPCSNTFLTHDTLTVAQLSVDSVLWILVTKRHGVSIDDDGDVNKRMEYGTGRTDVALQLPLVSL